MQELGRDPEGGAPEDGKGTRGDWATEDWATEDSEMGIGKLLNREHWVIVMMVNLLLI